MLGDNIKELMRAKKVTSKELAEITGVTPTHISYIINNRRQPSLDLVEKIAAILDVSVNELFNSESSESSNNETKIMDDINKIVEKNKIETIAAHFDGEEFTKEDLKDIEQFIKFVAARKKNKD